MRERGVIVTRTEELVPGTGGKGEIVELVKKVLLWCLGVALGLFSFAYPPFGAVFLVVFVLLRLLRR